MAQIIMTQIRNCDRTTKSGPKKCNWNVGRVDHERAVEDQRRAGCQQKGAMGRKINATEPQREAKVDHKRTISRERGGPWEDHTRVIVVG
eukprot:2106569-Amphidinium_carterae.1